MPIGWFISPYQRTDDPFPVRQPAINDYRLDIEAAGGKLKYTEVLGNFCIAKVRSSVAVLNTIAADDRIQQLPKDRLDDPLSDLSNAALKKIRDILLAMGYPLAEIKQKFGDSINLKDFTLRDVLKFASRRRLKPRYDSSTDQFYIDGTAQPVKPL